jgi:SAM-dependent methyltransferase
MDAGLLKEGPGAADTSAHWVMMRQGKRVLRPGGLALTHQMLDALEIGPLDSVVEFAPGMGVTAELAVRRRPASYTAVERDRGAAARLQRILARRGTKIIVVHGDAAKTGLGTGTATAVYCEAMLTMQTLEGKRRIITEARRLLRAGGRFGIHELCLVPDDVSDAVRREVWDILALAHRGTEPVTACEWREILQSEGFNVRRQRMVPMRLLEPIGLIRDEGVFGSLRFALNLARNGEARRRIGAMRSAFRRCQPHVRAFVMIAQAR